MHWLVALGIGYLAGEVYKRYVPEETKRAWESKIRSHHGEWGLTGAITGLATGHYGLAASSAGLALHDWPDKDKWFSGDKENSNYSI